MIRCIIIDDEQHAIDVVNSFCQRIPYLEILGEFTNPLDAPPFIEAHQNKIDLAFLDIEMPQLSGIDFLKVYKFNHVILVTAYSEYALDSYQYGVVDYLLKPYSFDRFCQAVTKVYEKQTRQNSLSENYKKDYAFIYLKTDRNKYIKLSYSEIKYIQGAQNHSVIRTTSGEIVAPLRLKDLCNQLPADRFIRVHKSHIIHIDYFQSLDGNAIKVKAEERTLLLGTTYKQDFINFLHKQIDT